MSEGVGLTNTDLESIGFKPLQHFTVGNTVNFDLNRRRYLSASSVGTGNEVIFICEKSKVGDYMTDLVCVHNYDHDGFITLERLKALIDWFGGENDE